MDEPIRVVVVSGVRLYGEGITAALSLDDRFEVVATAGRLGEVLRGGDAAAADVVLLDVSAIEDPGAAGPVLAEIQIPIVGLAVRDSETDVLAWAKLGVAGILTRAASLAELRTAINAAAGMEAHCSPAVVATLLRSMAGGGDPGARTSARALLTSREREIGELLANGCTNKEIASQLFLGVSTVKNHVHNVLQKLGARSRTEAATRLRGQGI